VDRKYVVITGHGRSGSNLLLDMMDCHEATFCRNEPNELKLSRLSGLPNPLMPEALPADFSCQFSAALEEAAVCNGARDRVRHSHKQYARGHVLGGLSGVFMSRGKLRKA